MTPEEKFEAWWAAAGYPVPAEDATDGEWDAYHLRYGLAWTAFKGGWDARHHEARPTRFPGYEVDATGRVWSVLYHRDRGRHEIAKSERNGYATVRLEVGEGPRGRRVRVFVHRLVAEAFLGECPSPRHQVRHLNGIRDDNRLENLAWGTAKENEADKVRHGRTTIGSRNPAAKLDEPRVAVIKRLLIDRVPVRDIAARFGVCQNLVRLIRRGELWTHVAPAEAA